MNDSEKTRGIINRILKDEEALSSKKILNPFYGKELYFFEDCIGPRLDRNQLFGYIGAFSGNNYKLKSTIDFCIYPDSSFEKLISGKLDANSIALSDLIFYRKKSGSKITDKIRATLIIREEKIYTRVYSFIKNDPVKVSQYNKLNLEY